MKHSTFETSTLMMSVTPAVTVVPSSVSVKCSSSLSESSSPLGRLSGILEPEVSLFGKAARLLRLSFLSLSLGFPFDLSFEPEPEPFWPY